MNPPQVYSRSFSWLISSMLMVLILVLKHILPSMYLQFYFIYREFRLVYSSTRRNFSHTYLLFQRILLCLFCSVLFGGDTWEYCCAL